MPPRKKINSQTDLRTVPKQWVRFKLHEDVLERLDELAAHKSQTRGETISEAVGWLLARDAEWMRREQVKERERRWREEDERERQRLVRERHPERFD